MAPSGRFFALKCLSKAELLRMGQIPHLMNEKFVLQQIHHPSLVNMEGVFHDPSYVYMVLEYVVGGELYMYTAEAGKLKNPAARFYAGQIVKALSYLHSKNIVYRDLKPENILLDSVGYVKVTDFGFAKQLQPGERTHTVCGV
jgi:protein kinase X